MLCSTCIWTSKGEYFLQAAEAGSTLRHSPERFEDTPSLEGDELDIVNGLRPRVGVSNPRNNCFVNCVDGERSRRGTTQSHSRKKFSGETLK
jgi:hypothetical protein